jgi:multidrug efflux pump subunit AcrA (membrane-fusion protein)/YHS domain-containing protein
MKKVLAGILIGLLMLVSYVAGRKHSQHAGSAAANGGRRVLFWVDPMHPDYKSDHAGLAPDCGMQLEPVYAESIAAAGSSAAPIPPGMVGIDSEKQQLFGIRISTVERSSGTENVRVLGRVLPEDTRVYRINAGMEGFVRETFNDSPGELVKKNQKLATYYGGDILAVASGFLAATAGVPGANGKDGSRTVPFPGAVSKQGSSSVQGYTDRLRNLGMSDVQIQQMSETRLLPESIDIVSPVDGFVLARNISPGQHFAHSTEFYRIADLSSVWIVADILGNEAQRFRPGTTARAVLSGEGKALTARVSNVLPQVDPTTRTLKLRLVAENPGFVLRPDMFVDVELPIARPAGLTVPVDAVIDSGREQRVFVQRSNGVFEPRNVQVGLRFADRVEIVKGLSEGERVVSAGTFLVDSESRLKSVQSAPKEQPQPKLPPKSNTGTAVSANTVKDAACGMTIDAAKAVAEGHTITRNGVTYYFCSDRCQRKFSEQPDHYLAANPSGPHS